MIKLPIPALAQHQLNTLTTHSTATALDLKMGQKMDANIIQVAPDKQSIQLHIAQQKITVFIQTESLESKQQLAQLKTGDTIQLIVSKLHPQAELKALLSPDNSNTSKNTNTALTISHKDLTLTLKPSPTQRLPTEISSKPAHLSSAKILPLLQTPKNTTQAPLLASLNNQQQLNATILQVQGKSITVRLLIPVMPAAISPLKPTTLAQPATLQSQAPSSPTSTPPPFTLNISTASASPLKPTTLAQPVTVQSQAFSNPTSTPSLSTLSTLNISTASASVPLPPSSTSVLNTSTAPLPTTQANYKALTITFPLPPQNTRLAQATLSAQQLITLQIVKTGPAPQFKILPPPTTEETINTAFRELLPKELAPQELLNQIGKNLPDIMRHEQVSDTLKRLAQEILSKLPSKQQITEGKQLKKALDNNGTYLEPKLSQTLTDPKPLNLTNDFKANLLKLIQTLQQEPAHTESDTSDNEAMKLLLKEVQTKSEGALARLMLNQLKSLPQEDPNKQVWAIELPFTDKKEKTTSVQIQIEENNKQAEDPEQKSWSATLTLTPPNMQTLHCKVSYLNQAVHTNFWSEHEQTTQLIQHNLDYLSQRLEEVGLTPGNMIASQQNQHQQTKINIESKRLFDDNA